MLVTMKEILKIADEGGYAVGAFNVPSLVNAKAIIAAAEELNKPVILMHAQIHEEQDVAIMEEVAPIMRFFAERAKVPVCTMLDHGEDLEYVKRGLELGFTAVMYDGSALPPEENYKNTKYVVELAHKYGASVEAEVGSMGTRESGDATDGGSIYTDPEEAAKFVRETGVDALACAFGTAHGLYLKQPKLDFDRLAKIKELVDVPLVMHGGSGVSREDFERVIRIGIRKVNYYAYMAKAGADAVKAMKDQTYWHDMEKAAICGIKANVKEAMEMFALGK